MWNAKLLKSTEGKTKQLYMKVNLPAPLARALEEQGYTHVHIFINDDGILLRPYKSNAKGYGDDVELPDWK